MKTIQEIREEIRHFHLKDEVEVLSALQENSVLSMDQRNRMVSRASTLIEDIRNDDRPALLEVFLAEYGLSTNEGVALMCLAEALMRVPDAETMDHLIEDKIAPSAWSEHKGHSNSMLVNASTWGLMLTGKVLDDHASKGIGATIHGLVKRLGEPVIRLAVKHAMKELGSQFVLGETIGDAVKRGKKQEEDGYTFSYDMLGEAALTKKDADKFFQSYKASIEYLASHAKADTVAENPGISIKLSALHPRYEVGQRDRVMTELVESTLALTLLAKEANMGLNIDAEEADRLDLSLDVIEAVLSDPRLEGWDGFGVVVQAYGKRASFVIDWLYNLSVKLDRKIMVRLVKGAYWDTEIKRAQVEGLSDFPVFTKKSATDCSYIYCAEKLLAMTDRIYPQFATHNANSVAMILELATDEAAFEFQRLHGMGEVLHRLVHERENVRCRIYAPVGPHRDLLAYLVRRLLENGANSSFVNQIVDTSVPVSEIADDPIVTHSESLKNAGGFIKKPVDLYGAERPNSKGWDLHNDDDVEAIDAARGPFMNTTWEIAPLTAEKATGAETMTVTNPANPDDVLGHVLLASPGDVEKAIAEAEDWTGVSAKDRAFVLNKAADIYEENFGKIFAILTREAGKTPMDAIAELREAVDFLRYYAARAAELEGRAARGIFTCISPWNFPLAIFTGQIVAALSVGNGVLAKPAEQTPIMAHVAVELLHQAGVPRTALQLLPGTGAVVGAGLVANKQVAGVCFTGSTQTAQHINRGMAEHAVSSAPLIAETGGLNAMIVDSTALPEQAVKDIVASAFQSAGQRCSALRLLYLQEDIKETFLEMLYGAMDELCVGNPWDYKTDVGPVIDETARTKINSYIAAVKGRVMKQIACPDTGTFVAPTVLKVSGIKEMAEEIFGPVLHVATFKASEIDQIIEDVNASGYGLTFGLHTRIDDRVQHITSNLCVGNMYVNRNQIGAIVGSQPFGGEGMSGTGPKAGGPAYVKRFTKEKTVSLPLPAMDEVLSFDAVQELISKAVPEKRGKLSRHILPGPTGEKNELSVYGRGVILCLGPTVEAAEKQADIVRRSGAVPVVLEGHLERDFLSRLVGFDAVVSWSEETDLKAIRSALAKRDGMIIPLISADDFADRCVLERHICIDTTAAGGNAALLAVAS
ncbi:bifunctional proline dehydrogenase/L-glutamate gamma-semialdehyde dehydrogenase PutA [Terasakiella sp. A23]|uniref:bifunctional proline dehydrogenase/L-glutamate gamma-semialdehyde dehydrogenase PutA n=1 Tax=Terasakiella sp. FCG-A23 TaxID=3080561 RepID=UPI0029556A84|nr:bifunctional proline dehydrogenase/L-glutamate gamma-semialdehyde dehydrogenase PutA [Terasakiella sp. A23]MDV7339475.1 bifunctional proline dehydrogenase/L-glutamate gamma-semialdehyde dehydrogenase PutA [Terasakiella sp. A23]